MIKGLIINAAILFSFFAIVNQLLKEIEVKQELCYKRHELSYKLRVLLGVTYGIVGAVLIIFSVLVTPTFIIDFRQVAIIVSAYYGGWMPAIITGIIISGFRLIYMGINHMAVVGSVAGQVIAIGCALISLLCIEQRKKWVLMTGYCIIISSIVFSILITDLAQLKQIIIIYSIGLVILSCLAYYHTNYLIISNRLMRRLKAESSKDFLTGLDNVRSFNDIYNDLMQTAVKRNEQLSVLTIDIDHFKMINDTYGHQTGDKVLKELANLLIKTCRQFDIISRKGGEEFSVLLVDCPPEKANNIGERIRQAVEEHKFILQERKLINITVSIGIATFPDMTQDKQQLLELSDKALYKAKNTGRNKVCIIE